MARLMKIGKFAQLQAGKQALALAREVRDIDIIGEALQAQWGVKEAKERCNAHLISYVFALFDPFPGLIWILRISSLYPTSSALPIFAFVIFGESASRFRCQHVNTTFHQEIQNNLTDPNGCLTVLGSPIVL